MCELILRGLFKWSATGLFFKQLGKNVSFAVSLVFRRENSHYYYTFAARFKNY
jgi:hypothetical protein